MKGLGNEISPLNTPRYCNSGIKPTLFSPFASSAVVTILSDGEYSAGRATCRRRVAPTVAGRRGGRRHAGGRHRRRRRRRLPTRSGNSTVEGKREKVKRDDAPGTMMLTVDSLGPAAGARVAHARHCIEQLSDR